MGKHLVDVCIAKLDIDNSLKDARSLEIAEKVSVPLIGSVDGHL